MTTKKNDSGFTDAERAAELKASGFKASGRGGAKEAGETQACLDKIAEMSNPTAGSLSVSTHGELPAGHLDRFWPDVGPNGFV